MDPCSTLVYGGAKNSYHDQTPVVTVIISSWEMTNKFGRNSRYKRVRLRIMVRARCVVTAGCVWWVWCGRFLDWRLNCSTLAHVAMTSETTRYFCICSRATVNRVDCADCICQVRTAVSKTLIRLFEVDVLDTLLEDTSAQKDAYNRLVRISYRC